MEDSANTIVIKEAPARESLYHRVMFGVGGFVFPAVFVVSLLPQVKMDLVTQIASGCIVVFFAYVGYEIVKLDRRVVRIQEMARERLNQLPRPVPRPSVFRACRLITIAHGWPCQGTIRSQDILKLENDLGLALPRVWIFQSAQRSTAKPKESGRVMGVPFGLEGVFCRWWFWICFALMLGSMPAAVIAVRVMHVSPFPTQLVGLFALNALFIPGIFVRSILWRVILTDRSISVERVNKQGEVIENREISLISTFVFVRRAKWSGFSETHGPTWFFYVAEPGESFRAYPPDVSRNPWCEELGLLTRPVLTGESSKQ